jgi:hypothetical protein
MVKRVAKMSLFSLVFISTFAGATLVPPKFANASVVTSKPAIGGRVKTGQWEAVRD